MPYKRSGKRVYVRRAGRWALLKAHAGARAAERHLKALRANVRH